MFAANRLHAWDAGDVVLQCSAPFDGAAVSVRSHGQGAARWQGLAGGRPQGTGEGQARIKPQNRHLVLPCCLQRRQHNVTGFVTQFPVKYPDCELFLSPSQADVSRTSVFVHVTLQAAVHSGLSRARIHV